MAELAAVYTSHIEHEYANGPGVRERMLMSMKRLSGMHSRLPIHDFRLPEGPATNDYLLLKTV